MTGSLERFRGRKFHREFIKPSSATPSHLKTYNLSLYDQSAENAFTPTLVAFYPNNNTSILNITVADLKKSLSRTLTKYYPFAGRLVPNNAPAAYVDCNDAGAVFLETSIDTTLSDFLIQKSSQHHQDLERFFHCDSPWFKSLNGPSDVDKVISASVVLVVQVSHFECGGMAVAAALSHKVADASSLTHFLSDWAKTTRFICSKDDQKHDQLPASDPYFHHFPEIDMKLHGFSVERSEDCVVRSFIFPNLKINRLKLKVKAMTTASNLTRIEVLSWLLFKCAVAAATENNSGLSTFKPTGVHIPINARSKMIESLPEKTIGNFSLIMKIQTKNENDMKPESFISEIRKQKKQFQSLKNIETAFGLDSNNMYSKTAIEEFQRKVEGCCYICTSMCGYPIYDIDFGWGKPLKATIAGNCGKNSFILMDTPNGDGIEVLACLGKQDMNIFQTNPVLLACCAIHHQSRFALYDVDFGWVKLIKATTVGTLMNNSFIACHGYDAPDGHIWHGSLVSLQKQDMYIFQLEDSLLLSLIC